MHVVLCVLQVFVYETNFTFNCVQHLTTCLPSPRALHRHLVSASGAEAPCGSSGCVDRFRQSTCRCAGLLGQEDLSSDVLY